MLFLWVNEKAAKFSLGSSLFVLPIDLQNRQLTTEPTAHYRTNSLLYTSKHHGPFIGLFYRGVLYCFLIVY